VAALAIGIGANAAIFSLVNQVLLNPAGVRNPERVLAIRARYDKLNLKSIPVSAPDFAGVRDSRQVFEHAAMLSPADFNYTGGEAPERIQGAEVTREWFDVFGARPLLGRVFTAQEDQPNSNQVTVLSYALWQRLFGGDPLVVGKAISLNDKTYRIVGVMPADFRWPREAELWAPMGLEASAFTEQNRFNESYFGFARIREGGSFAKADAWIQVLANRVKSSGTRSAAYAGDSAWGMFGVPLTDYVAGETKKPLLILLGAVGFVLLIACSNIAGLMLARTAGRVREIAVRVAMGAGRWRLMRQTMAESALLAAGGAAAGLALAYAGVQALLALAPQSAVTGLGARLDPQVLWFTAAASALSALLFGLAPAWQIARMDPHDILKGSGRSGMAGRGRQQLRALLVVGETALALVLLAGAGWFLRSLARLEDVHPGFEPRGVMTATLTLPRTRYPDDAKRIPFYRAVAERLAAAPGVTAAGMGIPLPFSGSESSASFSIEGRNVGPGDPGPHGDVRVVSPGYFEALHVPLRTGRLFSDQDRAETGLVAVIDENLARQYWPGESPLGKHIRGGVRGGEWATVVGVVGHVRHSSLASDSGKGVYYYSVWQRSAPYTTVVLRTSGDPARFASAIREAVRAADPAQPVHDLKTMADLVNASLAPRRFVVRMLGFFAAAALLLAALGLYGVIGYSVAQRTQEIGIRMALGAQRSAVLRMVLAQGTRLAGAGAVLGALVSVLLGRWLASQIPGIGGFDLPILAVTIAVLMAAAILASLLPATRATRVDPYEALRRE
jgi:predicted permease